MKKSRKLYVMISKTHTGIGKAIRKFSRYPYNHVALTLEPDFRNWVSFARYNRDTPLYGGFIVEPVERYLADSKSNSVEVRIFAVDITEEHYHKLSELFSYAGKLDSGMVYNLFDIIAATVGAKIPIANAYTCLGFARAVLGKDYRSIRALDKDLQQNIIFEGSLANLACDSGDRSNLYFTRLGFIKGTKKTFKTFAILTFRAVKGDNSDTIADKLNKTTHHAE